MPLALDLNNWSLIVTNSEEVGKFNRSDPMMPPLCIVNAWPLIKIFLILDQNLVMKSSRKEEKKTETLGIG